MPLTGVQALEEWCRRSLDGSGVEVRNLTTCWRDGIGFCALIQRYRPDLIDITTLNHKNWKGNLELAFGIAENNLGIARLLDPEDLLKTQTPDRFSILTYLSQYYHTFCPLDSGFDMQDSPELDFDPELNKDVNAQRSILLHPGAVHSLMTERRVRSLSNHRRKRAIKSRPQSRSPDRKVESAMMSSQADHPYQPVPELTRRRSRCLLRKSSGQQKLLFPQQQSTCKEAVLNENKEDEKKSDACMIISPPDREVLVERCTNAVLSFTPSPRPYRKHEHRRSSSLLCTASGARRMLHNG